MKNVFLLLIVLALVACEQSENAAASQVERAESYQGVNIDDFELENVPGTDWQKATKYGPDGNVVESGYFENGRKTGTWLTYQPQSGELFPRTLSNYRNGTLYGLHMQFGQGGQIEVVAHYRDNNLHGKYAKYRFGRLLEESTYKNGKLDGVYNVYNVRDGKLRTSAEYKDGVQHGFYRTYNADGEVTTEYTYENGEKVSGGVK